VKLLEIQSSPRGESSDSITLTKSFVEACKSDNPSIVVDRSRRRTRAGTIAPRVKIYSQRRRPQNPHQHCRQIRIRETVAMAKRVRQSSLSPDKSRYRTLRTRATRR